MQRFNSVFSYSSALLLVIFAYHGGDGVGSWFYSLIVVVSGLAFVVFGPLLLCRFLIYAYYRQMDVHTQNMAGIYARVKKFLRFDQDNLFCFYCLSFCF